MSDASTTAPADAPAQPGTGSAGLFLVVVDNTPEMRVALRWASLRARRTRGHVALLRVIRAADYQHWAAIGNLMQVEAREEAEQLLQEYAAEVMSLHGEIGRAHVRTPVTNAPNVCRLLLEIKK